MVLKALRYLTQGLRDGAQGSREFLGLRFWGLVLGFRRLGGTGSRLFVGIQDFDGFGV